MLNTPDPLPDMFARWKATKAELDALNDPDASPLWEDWLELEQRICSTRATSPAGVLAQLEYAAANDVQLGSSIEPWGHLLFENMRGALDKFVEQESPS